MMADLKKRATVYGIQDNRMKEKILCFIKENKYANRKGWGVSEVSAYRIRWVKFMEQYLMNGDTSAMPENWAKSEVFPVCNIATLGNAGARKTRSMIDIHATQPDFTVTRPVNKSTNAYTAALMHSTQPQSRRHELHWNTFHKFIPIQYSYRMTRNLYNTLIKSDKLSEKYVAYVTDTTLDDATYKTRELTEFVLTAASKLIRCIIDCRIKEFLQTIPSVDIGQETQVLSKS
jgi:hypothetical protein